MSLTPLKPEFLRTCSKNYDKVTNWKFFIEERGRGRWTVIGYNNTTGQKFHVTGEDQMAVVAKVIEYAHSLDSRIVHSHSAV
ncbi:hypothetical protein KKF84_13050 [Myxococcota bacterium]|nr:hypothetical protein [Myxococcota bacterium]MBU1536245.1 hypothetical protein [Myxococcota bacterium]